MSFGRALKRRARDAMLPLAFAGLCAYFAWHAQIGDFGLESRERKMADIAQARAALARAEAELDSMERRVCGMKGDGCRIKGVPLTTVDRDQLDERARTVLNLSGKDEIVIPYDPARPLFR